MQSNNSYLPHQQEHRQDHQQAHQQDHQQQPHPYYQLERQLEQQTDQQNQIQTVSQIIRNNMPMAYQQINQIRERSNDQERQIPLHHSRGTRLASGQDQVLEFDIAGSGFYQFRNKHLNIDGSKNQLVDYIKAKIPWYAKPFQWIPAVKRHFQQKDLDKAKSYQQSPGTQRLTESELYNVEMVRNWEKRIGSTPYTRKKGTETKRMEHIHKKEQGNKTRITMAGPLGMGGMSNTGDYSIENLRTYISVLSQKYLTPVFEQWDHQQQTDQQESPPVIWLRIRGHSRGAVATIEGAMMIRHWLKHNEQYSHYADRVKFDITQFDPVPGFGSRSGTHKSIDLAGNNSLPPDMEPLDESAETTVVYSMHTQYSQFFTPQQVEHTKRIILAPLKHSAGLEQVDTHASSQEGERHRAAFIDATSGEAFRLSSLNELDPGVYVMDEKNVLVPMHNLREYTELMENIRTQRDMTGQEERHQVLDDVVARWFQANPIQQNQGNPADGTP